MDFTKIPSKDIIDKTISALKANGINTYAAINREDAKSKLLALLPKGVEVMLMTSVTLQELGIKDEIENSDKYFLVKKKLEKMDRKTQNSEMQKLGATPEYVLGSVHAVTQDGKVMIASNTGSQLPAYAYGSSHVIWVVGMQKIVKDLDEGFKRLYEYSLPLESERAKKAYGVPGSFISKILILNREINLNRINIILVPEVVGF